MGQGRRQKKLESSLCFFVYMERKALGRGMGEKEERHGWKGVGEAEERRMACEEGRSWKAFVMSSCIFSKLSL